MSITNEPHPCTICGTPMPDYIPMGDDFGRLLEPDVCSEVCYDKLKEIIDSQNTQAKGFVDKLRGAQTDIDIETKALISENLWGLYV